MSPIVSFDVRQAEDRATGGPTEVALIILRHPDLEEPFRISSDRTVKLSNDPVRYGTRSTWLTPGGEPFLYISMGASVPNEPNDVEATASIAVLDVDGRIAKLLKDSHDEITLDIAVVYAHAPNTPLRFWQNFRVSSAEGQPGLVNFLLTAFQILQELHPTVRMTRDRCPALFD